MAVSGMNVDLVVQASKKIDDEGRQLGQIIASVNSIVTNLEWSGPDQRAFVTEWGNQVKSMQRTIQILEEAARTMRKEAEEQRRVSGG